MATTNATAALVVATTNATANLPAPPVGMVTRVPRVFTLALPGGGSAEVKGTFVVSEAMAEADKRGDALAYVIASLAELAKAETVTLKDISAATALAIGAWQDGKRRHTTTGKELSRYLRDMLTIRAPHLAALLPSAEPTPALPEPVKEEKKGKGGKGSRKGKGRASAEPAVVPVVPVADPTTATATATA